ncbi:MAG TPA: hypothetical protein VLE96_06245 [Chlamydiales bacterium]|nr:hypothetical protein [Chlamydiales bacterium]
MVHVVVSGGKNNWCCCGEDSSFTLHFIVREKNRTTAPIAVASPAAIESKDVDSKNLDQLKKLSKSGLYLIGRCTNRECNEYFNEKLIYGGAVSKGSPCSISRKINTTPCPCCSQKKLECTAVGMKGSNWKWEGAKTIETSSEEKEGEWTGDKISEKIIDLAGWNYLEILHCE